MKSRKGNAAYRRRQVMLLQSYMGSISNKLNSERMYDDYGVRVVPRWLRAVGGMFYGWGFLWVLLPLIGFCWYLLFARELYAGHGAVSLVLGVLLVGPVVLNFYKSYIES